MKLSQEQIRFFRQAGYIKLKHRVSSETTQQLREAVQRDIERRVAPYITDSQGRIIRLSNIIDRDPMFLQLFTSPLILDPLEALLGQNIEFTRNRHNHATINLKGSPTPRLHRDILQWSRSLVTVIFYLEEATVENGCTHIIPGSHFLPFVGDPNNGGAWMDEHSIYADLVDQSIPVPMSEGSILIFDSLMFHSTGVNMTESMRMIITTSYHSVDELSGAQDDPKLLLVRGERIYKGNDSTVGKIQQRN